jgi:hypothetical protein
MIEVQNIIKMIELMGNLRNPDWSPLLDAKAAANLLIEKMWTNTDILFTEDEALEFMKEQIKRNSELQKLQQETWWTTQEQGQVLKTPTEWVQWWGTNILLPNTNNNARGEWVTNQAI